MDSAVHFEMPYQVRKQKVMDASGKLLGVPDTTRNWNTI